MASKQSPSSPAVVTHWVGAPEPLCSVCTTKVGRPAAMLCARGESRTELATEQQKKRFSIARAKEVVEYVGNNSCLEPHTHR